MPSVLVSSEDEVPDRSAILTVNGGSSSLKFALFDAIDPTHRLASGRIERVGRPGSRLIVGGRDGGREEVRPVDAPDLKAAASLVIDWLEGTRGLATVAVIGHRVVHGGPNYHRPERITEGVIEELRRLIPFDPDHLPGEIVLIETFRDHNPATSQVACFDTAFHHEMPRVAQIVPIPRRYESIGIRRYGFHGLSYEYLMEELHRVDETESRSRLILAHLGSGASLAAVREGTCLDTSMGLTPASGLMMGTRSGDIDPGLVRFLFGEEGMTPERFDTMVNRESGLLGVSETSPDLRDLLDRRASDVRASEAVDLFCYGAKKGIGAFAAALGGLDTLVFAGGIGENSSEVRRRICDGLGFLGIALDEARNEANAPVISTDASPTRVRIIRTDEELMIARAAAHLASRPA